MRHRAALTASCLAYLLAIAAPPQAAILEPPASRATPSIQHLASHRAAPPIGAGVDVSLHRGCAPLQPREPSHVLYSHGWRLTAAHAWLSGFCDKLPTWRT